MQAIDGVLQHLSKTAIKCRLDNPPENGIPDDLLEGTYRWRLYVYTCIEKEDLSSDEKQALIQVSEKFRDEHLISWTRDKLLALKEKDIAVSRELLNNTLQATSSADVLRVCIYVLRMINKKFYIVDPIILRTIPGLMGYAE
jgi:hypothetical protein